MFAYDLQPEDCNFGGQRPGYQLVVFHVKPVDSATALLRKDQLWGVSRCLGAVFLALPLLKPQEKRILHTPARNGR